jgi:lysophospholipase L1-like esterase
MQHLEAYSSQLTDQHHLPLPGEKVIVDGWQSRGYVQLLTTQLRLTHPGLRFAVDNRAAAGATSRDLLGIVRHFQQTSSAEIAVLCCGINDVWRGYQGRGPEAVSLKEFGLNYIRMIATLRRAAKHVVCLSETPFGWDDDCDVAAMNAELARYNELARRAAHAQDAEYADLWHPMLDAARQLGGGRPPSPADPTLWSDGVHLSDLGDTLVANLLHDVLLRAHLPGGRSQVAPPRTSGAPSRAESAVRSSGCSCDSRSALTRSR